MILSLGSNTRGNHCAAAEAGETDEAAIASKEDEGDDLVVVDEASRLPLVRKVACKLSRFPTVKGARAHFTGHLESDHQTNDEPGETPDVDRAAAEDGNCSKESAASGNSEVRCDGYDDGGKIEEEAPHEPCLKL